MHNRAVNINYREAHHRAFCDYLAKRGPVAMTVTEVAEVLNVSERHIYKLVSENKIPHVKIGSAVRFDAGDLIDWIKRMAAEHDPSQ